jgi:hypothetical protein
VPRGRPGPRGLKVHRTRLLHPDDFTFRDGIPVTSVARSLLDLASLLTPRQLELAVDKSERQDLFDLTAVQAALSRARGRRGVSALRKAIAVWQPRHTRMGLEERFRELGREAVVPSPQLNVLVHGERHVHEVDAHWPGRRLVVELDSYAFHRTRRDLERDAYKTADLELAGCRVARLTWNDIARDKDRTIRRLKTLLASDT